jgi:hypothetical protein
MEEGDAGMAWVYWHGADNYLSLYESGDDSLVVKDGNVGIGTTSPGGKLHVYDSWFPVNVEAESDWTDAYFVADADTDDNSGLRMEEAGVAKAYVRWNGWSEYLSLYESGGNRLVIKGGNVGINTTIPGYKLEVDGPVVLENSSAPSLPADHAGIYATGGELYAIDAANNTTLLSPHDDETGEWIFYSKNTKTGRVVRVDMERLVKAVEEVTGEKFMVETWEEPSEK